MPFHGGRPRRVLARFSSPSTCALQACQLKRCLAVIERSLIAYQLPNHETGSYEVVILGRFSREPLKCKAS
jgi:hypothetical protein